MSRLLSAIPNICEGQNAAFIDALTQKLSLVDGLAILDVSMDQTRNRTVFALTGEKKALFDGGLIMYRESIQNIDMRKHQGEYPRIGAVDVFPFVPLSGVSIRETVDVALEFAQIVAQEFKIPVYMFSEAAQNPLRRDIERIRDVEYEGLEERLRDPQWQPDFGPNVFKPDFGATIIGARYPLVSFKVYLGCKDVKVASHMADAIQYATGGFRNVTAHWGSVSETGQALIAISISNYKTTPIHKVIEMLKIEGQRYGVQIQNVEMIGLIPEIVFIDAAKYYLKVNDFSNDRLLERNIQKHLHQEFVLEDKQTVPQS
jgi:glutamate formiminotransferase